MEKKEPIGIEVKPDTSYTVAGIFGKGVVFFDKNGKEIGRKYFKNGEDSTSFVSPKEAIGFKLLMK